MLVVRYGVGQWRLCLLWWFDVRVVWFELICAAGVPVRGNIMVESGDAQVSSLARSDEQKYLVPLCY